MKLLYGRKKMIAAARCANDHPYGGMWPYNNIISNDTYHYISNTTDFNICKQFV